MTCRFQNCLTLVCTMFSSLFTSGLKTLAKLQTHIRPLALCAGKKVKHICEANFMKNLNMIKYLCFL